MTYLISKVRKMWHYCPLGVGSHYLKWNCMDVISDSENLNTRPLVRKQVDFLADKLIFQQLAWMGNWEIVMLYFAKN